MQDGIMKETGNSRYLKSTADFLSQYPTYEAFARALIDGTLPIDLSGVNPDGWAQQGTPLNKANLLTDATAALADLGREATPNEMLAALANRLKASITYGTSGLTSGTSNLATGTIYVKYE